MTTTVRFCFDYLSPYAYLAWHRVKAVAAARDVALEPWPTLLAGLLDHHGQRGPAEIPAKRVYVFKDSLRSASTLGVRLVPPPSHPFRPLLALRASSLAGGEAQVALIDGLFGVAWGGERHPEGGVEAAAVVARVADAAGLDGEALVTRASSDEAKARLKGQTEEAIGAGVFGVPTMLATMGARSELFWGLDSLGHLERFLDGADPLDDEALAAWAALPSSAVRPGSRSGNV